MVSFNMNVGLNLYKPTTKDSVSGLWNGNIIDTNIYQINVGSPTSTNLGQATWRVWYMYYNGTSIRHRVSSNSITFDSNMWPYVSPYELSPDIYIRADFDPYNYRHSSENKYCIELEFSDYSAEVLQYDSGVYGACKEAIQMLGESLGKVFKEGNIMNVSNNCRWNSFVDHPVTLDPDQKQYMFYGSQIPGYALPTRTAFLESFINDTTPFVGPYQSVPRNFRGSNYSKLTQLLNSQVQKESIGTSNIVLCVDEDATGSNLNKIKGHGYHLLNIKPSNGFNPEIWNRNYNFPFKPNANTFGGHIPWCDNSYGTYPLLDNCFCWNVITFTQWNGTSKSVGFISNCPNVGDVANTNLLPTKNFTYSGLLVKNAATSNGPSGYAMADGEWFDFKICPSSWHMSPSWDIICHSSQIKWCNMMPITVSGISGSISGFMRFELSRAGWHDITKAKLDAC